MGACMAADFITPGHELLKLGLRMLRLTEDDVFLGPSMVFTNVMNPRSAVNRKDQYAETIVEKGATIGANSTIVCGHRIGMFAFIGAGAVVTRDVKPYALVVGNPARQTGWMSEYGHKLQFDAGGHATMAAASIPLHVFSFVRDKEELLDLVIDPILQNFSRLVGLLEDESDEV